MIRDDYYFMERALMQAKVAMKNGEVPVGAVVVKDGRIIARGYNRRETDRDPTAHAELIAMKKASGVLNSWRLTDCTLYVTLEPCPMCAGVIVNSRISKVVFGAYDEKAGCATTLFRLCNSEKFNHRAEVVGGVMEKECGQVLSDFFLMRRYEKR